MNGCLEKARAGDPRARDVLVEILRPRIAKMSAYYARCSGEDADDLLQEAWIGLLEALPEVDMRIGTPVQYLIARARWRLLDAIKRNRVRRCLPLEDGYADSAPAPAGDAAEGQAFYTDFTGLLKSNQRAVLKCLMSGLTWREAGAALGCTSANIAYHVRQIRRKYEEWADDEAAACV